MTGKYLRESILFLCVCLSLLLGYTYGSKWAQLRVYELGYDLGHHSGTTETAAAHEQKGKVRAKCVCGQEIEYRGKARMHIDKLPNGLFPHPAVPEKEG